MMKQWINSIFLLAGLVAIGAGYQNCSKMEITKIDPVAKARVLNSTNVLSSTESNGIRSSGGTEHTYNPGSNSNTCPDGSPLPSDGNCEENNTCPDGSPLPPDGNCDNNNTCPDGSPLPSDGNCEENRLVEIPIHTECRNKFIKKLDTSLLRSNKIMVLIRSSSSWETINGCYYQDNSIKDQVISGSKGNRKFSIKQECANKLVPGSYNLRVFDGESYNNVTLLTDSTERGNTLPSVNFKILSDGRVDLEENIGLVFNFNFGGDYYNSSNATITFEGSTWYISQIELDTFNNRKCDMIGSPLVIDLHSKMETPKPINLTSQLEGILFDILGLNSFPAPHTKKRISWTSSKQYAWLTLPNQNGKIEGINEMFGDNTLGPDGKFAANGYAALAKYDGKDNKGQTQFIEADGKITKEDPIYYDLRLWRDLNFNGKSESNELQTLEEVGLIAIDLEFDDSFNETDQYGNKTTLKSVVKFKDGRYRLIFDLWFRFLN